MASIEDELWEGIYDLLDTRDNVSRGEIRKEIESISESILPRITVTEPAHIKQSRKFLSQFTRLADEIKTPLEGLINSTSQGFLAASATLRDDRPTADSGAQDAVVQSLKSAQRALMAAVTALSDRPATDSRWLSNDKTGRVTVSEFAYNTREQQYAVKCCALARKHLPSLFGTKDDRDAIRCVADLAAKAWEIDYGQEVDLYHFARKAIKSASD